MLWDYLRRQYKLLVMLAVFACVFAAVFYLYDLPVEVVGYAAALCLALGAALFAVSFARYVRRRRTLERLMANVGEAAYHLPRPNGALEADYQALLRAVCADRALLAAESEAERREMLDYYTLWAHQIKTPIAAMDLLLQSDGARDTEALQAERFKIGQYVEMVLSYLRLGSESTDFVLRRCALDEIVRGCLRKYARLFILKKQTITFEPTGRTVLTDEKWLSFVIGQVLQNAIQYTPRGGSVRICGDGADLLIADSGIGIRAEDLPRVFEKGFTGYNGQAEKKSSGIGLYLCRCTMEKLGGAISAWSEPGQGTAIRLYLPDRPLEVE